MPPGRRCRPAPAARVDAPLPKSPPPKNSVGKQAATQKATKLVSHCLQKLIGSKRMIFRSVCVSVHLFFFSVMTRLLAGCKSTVRFESRGAYCTTHVMRLSFAKPAVAASLKPASANGEPSRRSFAYKSRPRSGRLGGHHPPSSKFMAEFRHSHHRELVISLVDTCSDGCPQ